jgi:signal transduction histidine kinase
VYWHADGHAISVSYATHPMVKNGEIIGAVTSFIDTSEQRAASEAREQALIEAEKLARIQRVPGQHEPRDPHAAQRGAGFANIGLRNSGNPEKAQASFSKILASGQHLLGVINDILDFSKIEAGKFVIEQTEVCLGDVIRQTCDMLAGSIEAKQLVLKLDIAPDLPPVCISDPLRIGQVLLNILSNAVKFTESGSVALSVVHDAQAVFFAVSDSGIGMNDEQVGQLFTPFHQADASASRRFGGTGLGLAISKRILDLMGGAISVESHLGVGSTFRFQVPLHLPPAEPGAGQEQAASQAAHDDSRWPACRSWWRRMSRSTR